MNLSLMPDSFTSCISLNLFHKFYIVPVRKDQVLILQLSHIKIYCVNIRAEIEF